MRCIFINVVGFVFSPFNLLFRFTKIIFNHSTKMTDENTDMPIDTNLITDSMEDDTAKEKKRKRQETLENKRLLEEEYDHELREQQYKRLMHLLNRSKFYASYIINKINGSTEKRDNEVGNLNVKKINAMDENTRPLEKRKKKVALSHDIRNYISEDVQKKLHLEKTNKTNLTKEEIENELVKNSDNQVTEANVVDIPKYFNGDLRNYQKEGFQWLKVLYENGINGILADEMGLGKTIQVITLLCHLIEKQQGGPYLIIAPLSTIPNWMIEFERFAPKLPVVVFHGTRDERLILRRKIKQKYKIAEMSYSTLPIVLTSFEIPLVENFFLKSLKWRYIIIDEGHRIKNYECLLIKVLKGCNSMNRLLLTGTPLQNNLAELWSLLNFLLPEIFDDLAVFESWFDAKELQYDEGTKKFLKLEEEKHVLSSLREILQPFMLRREKADVCLDIPPKKELIVYAPLTNLQHELYAAVLNRDIDRLTKTEETSSLIMDTEDGTRPKRKCVLKNMQNENKTIKNSEQKTTSSSNLLQESSDESSDREAWKGIKPVVKNDLSIWKQYTNINDYNQEFFVNIQLRNRLVMYKKIVNHPYLVYCPLDPYGLPKIDEDLIKSSGKLLVLDAMLPKLKERGHKILLFSTMTSILDMIQDYLSLRNYNYVRLDGKTQLEDRKKNIKNFNADPDLFVFLISTRAGGVGLNLAAADTVIIYDSDWNPQIDIQAMARCHRIGQTRPVVIYRLCTKGTIDEAIITRADAKRLLEKMVISKKIQTININSKQTLMELQRLLESKECQIATSENEAFTEDELDKLLDRSDMYTNSEEL